MREPLPIRVLTYGLLALFVFMVAVPLFWMVTTALKTNKDLYEDFSYLPTRPTLQHFVRVIEREDLLTNIWNSFAVASTTTVVTVFVSAFAAFSIASVSGSASSALNRPRLHHGAVAIGGGVGGGTSRPVQVSAADRDAVRPALRHRGGAGPG